MTRRLRPRSNVSVHLVMSSSVLSMFARLSKTVHWAPLDGRTICLRCIKRLTAVQQSGARPFSRSLRIRQVATIREDDLDRKFFWANTFQTSRRGETSRSVGQVTGNVGASNGKVTRSAIEDRAPLASTEPAHRRRKRLKTITPAESTAEIPLPPDASSTLSRDAAAAPAKSFRRLFSTYLALTKPRLAFLIVLTTTASYSIYPVPTLLSTSVTDAPSLSTLTLLFLTTGTFLAISSANTLNMLFEPQYDARMSRTRNRPLVRGLVSKRAALLFAVATGILGTSVLWYGVNPTVALLGGGNIALYAFAYTPLKRIHPVNTWVGAIVGAIPPLMGWCAAACQYSTSGASSASIWDESRELLLTEQAVGGWLIAALLFAWQFPHFFALSHAVRQEYAGAGYKMLTSSNIPMAARVSLRYSFAMFPICTGLCYCQVTDPAFAVTSSIVNAWMLREAFRFWRLNGEKGSARALFWASVWQLPIVLVLAMMQKRGLLERIWNSIFGDPDLADEWIEGEA